MQKASSSKKVKWVKTKHSNLYRNNDSGTYYARIQINGKEKWKSLKTKIQEQAKFKLRELQQQIAETKTIATGKDAKVEMKYFILEEIKEVENDSSIKESTKKYKTENLNAILKNWKGLSGRSLSSISETNCKNFFNRMWKKYSATRFNNMVWAMKNIFKKAKRLGIVFSNPVEDVKLKSLKSEAHKKILPTNEQFEAMVKEIDTVVGRGGKSRGQLVRFLAYTGLRANSEARWVTWGDIDFERDWLIVRGHPETGTKNQREIQRRSRGEYSHKLPLHKRLKKLLKEMRKGREEEGPNERVLQVLECQKSIDRACEKLGIPRMTPHDFRQFYTTKGVENGVPMSVLGSWRGDVNGGATALTHYYHIRDEEHQKIASKLKF